MAKLKTSVLGESAAVEGLVYSHNPQQFPNAPLQTDRNFGADVTLVTSDTTLDDLDSVVLVDATLGNVTIQLPFYSAYRTRLFYRLVRIDASANWVLLTPLATSADVINGLATPNGVYLARQYATLDVWCGDDSSGLHDGSGHGLWYAIPGGVLAVPDLRRLTTKLTPLVPSDADLTVGTSWGTAPSVTFDAGSNDLVGQVNVLADTGAGANPQVKITFKDGAFPSAPLVMVTPIGANTIYFRFLSSLTTSMNFQLVGTPPSGSTFRAAWLVVGR